MPSAKARDFQRVARAVGFLRAGQKESQEQWEHPNGRIVVIPIHGGREIGPPLFNRILEQLGISLDEFQRLR